MANFSITVINHSADIDYKDWMNNYREFRSKPYYFLTINTTLLTDYTAWKVSKYGVFSGSYFPIFGLNTETYSLNLEIHARFIRKMTLTDEIKMTRLTKIKLNTI